MGVRESSCEQQRLVDARFHSEAHYWNDIYRLDDLTSRIYQLRRDCTLATIDKLRLDRGRVLEIGCGAGVTAVALAQRGHDVQAVDRVDSMVTLTCQLAVENGVSDRLRAGICDVHSLPFSDGRFDLIVALGVFPWLHSPDRALREMARVLNPSGHLILTTDNRWCINYLLDPLCSPLLRPIRLMLRDALIWLRLLQPSRKPGLQMYSSREVDKFLARAGFQKLHSRTLGFGPFSMLKLRLFSESLYLKIHNRLQAAADRGLPLLRSAGIEYFVLAQRSPRGRG